jgi:hypothetical protein
MILKFGRIIYDDSKGSLEFNTFVHSDFIDRYADVFEIMINIDRHVIK